MSNGRRSEYELRDLKENWGEQFSTRKSCLLLQYGRSYCAKHLGNVWGSSATASKGFPVSCEAVLLGQVSGPTGRC